jgi:kojibiose phosphorylase
MQPNESMTMPAPAPSPGEPADLSAGHCELGGPAAESYAPTSDPAWLLSESGFVPAREHEIESILAIANGYVGTRASLAEGSLLSDPATYLANVYVSSSTGVPVLARAPQWLPVEAAVDRRPFMLQEGERHSHRRFLDMRQGLLWREWVHVDESGRRTRITGYRLASLVNRHLIAQVMYCTPENYSGLFTLQSGIGGAPGYSTVFWKHTQDDTAMSTATADLGEGRQVVAVGRSVIWLPDGKALRPAIEATQHAVYERWQFPVHVACRYRLDRLLFIYATPDEPSPIHRARAVAAAWDERGTDAMVAQHARRWAQRWNLCDVEVAGDESAQRALRFAAFHMSGSASAESGPAGIGPRGLTGGGYGGHVFWDTDIYVMPFLTYTQPEVARAVLGYRYRTLPAAREEAKVVGLSGASYAWESADTGRETPPNWVLRPDGQAARVYCGDEELHVTADVAYAVWQYWEATQDADYLAREGAEILAETARYWASLGRMEADGRVHLRNVMGPDEYHPTVDDNAYTNWMAARNLERAADALDLLEKLRPERATELRTRLAIRAGEPADWRRIAAAMEPGRRNAEGGVEQFAGYWDLAPSLLNADAALLLQTEELRGYQMVKQADLVMLLALFPDAIPPAEQWANFQYYEPRTRHGSSLSPGIHALVAARLGKSAEAERYFKQTAGIDLEMQGNAMVGVHLAALGSLWMTAIFGFGGVQFAGDTVRVSPHLPAQWSRLSFRLKYRGRILAFRIEPSGAHVTVESGEPLQIEIAS